MNDKEKGIWNGGTTKPNGVTKKEAMIFRQMEDSYDLDDSEIEFREELQKREEMMREEAKNQKIQSKYTLSKKPMHELYKGINKQINNFEKWSKERTNITGMGGVLRKK